MAAKKNDNNVNLDELYKRIESMEEKLDKLYKSQVSLVKKINDTKEYMEGSRDIISGVSDKMTKVDEHVTAGLEHNTEELLRIHTLFGSALAKIHTLVVAVNPDVATKITTEARSLVNSDAVQAKKENNETKTKQNIQQWTKNNYPIAITHFDKYRESVEKLAMDDKKYAKATTDDAKNIIRGDYLYKAIKDSKNPKELDELRNVHKNNLLKEKTQLTKDE